MVMFPSTEVIGFRWRRDEMHPAVIQAQKEGERTRLADGERTSI
jgi:hypothetical protein